MAYKKTTDGNAERPADDRVRFPVLLGVKPGKYLAALYLLAVLALLFFVLVFPGIVRRGSFVTFTSEPAGAAVRVDDVYFDAAPCTIFVPEGRRVFDFALPGFNGSSVEQDVGAGGFASLLFPRRIAVHAALIEKEPLAALTLGAVSAAEWSFTGENAEMYQTPLALSEGAYRSAPKDKRAADEILKAAARFTSTRFFVRDLIRAKFLAGNEGRSPSMFNAAVSMAEMTAFVADNPAFTGALVEVLGEEAKPLLESEWYRKNVIDNIFPPQSPEIERQSLNQRGFLNQAGLRYDPVFGGNLTVSGVRFVEIRGGVFKGSTDFDYETPVESFFLAANEVSDDEWAAFLVENPEWRQENTDALTENRLVNLQYMAKPDDKAYPAPTVSGVSWYAAEAYCRWLTSKLPSGFSGWEARLPSEIQWEYAAKGTVKGLDGGRITRMTPGRNEAGGQAGSLNQAGSQTGLLNQAGLWEWCEDLFVPVYFLGASGESIRAVGSPKRSVRGGSWVNPARTVSPETRAGLVPWSCSPFVSFRPVITRAGVSGGL
jgi:formylglycine-generating enzyme required for sulfatase activity